MYRETKQSSFGEQQPEERGYERGEEEEEEEEGEEAERTRADTCLKQDRAGFWTGVSIEHATTARLPAATLQTYTRVREHERTG